VARSGGTKPGTGKRRAERYQDGMRKGGGVNTQRHAGPGRRSKTPPTGVRGRQLEKRLKP
jgi:hypothetical protein